MSENNADTPEVNIEERITLSKFEGEPLPENEVERVQIVNGEVVELQFVSNGEVTETLDQDAAREYLAKEDT